MVVCGSRVRPDSSTDDGWWVFVVVCGSRVRPDSSTDDGWWVFVVVCGSRVRPDSSTDEGNSHVAAVLVKTSWYSQVDSERSHPHTPTNTHKLGRSRRLSWPPSCLSHRAATHHRELEAVEEEYRRRVAGLEGALARLQEQVVFRV